MTCAYDLYVDCPQIYTQLNMPRIQLWEVRTSNNHCVICILYLTAKCRLMHDVFIINGQSRKWYGIKFSFPQEIPQVMEKTWCNSLKHQKELIAFISNKENSISSHYPLTVFRTRSFSERLPLLADQGTSALMRAAAGPPYFEEHMGAKKEISHIGRTTSMEETKWRRFHLPVYH